MCVFMPLCDKFIFFNQVFNSKCFLGNNLVQKKILLIHFNRFPPITGGEYVYFKIYQALSTKFEVCNISITNLLLRFFPRKGLRGLAKFLLEPICVLYPLLVKNSYDLIFTSWADGMPFFGDVVYVQPDVGDRSKKFKVADHGNTFLNVVDALGTGMTWPWRMIFGKFSLKYHHCISNSKYTYEHLIKNYNKKSIIIYPPLNIKQKNLDFSKKERLVLSIGRVIPEKRFHLIGKIGPKLPNVKFVLIGKLEKSGESTIKFIKENFKKAGLCDNFVYLGYVSEELKNEYLEKASVIFHPAKDEAFGLVLVEGMSAGAIPVAHASGGPLEFIDSVWLFSDDFEIEGKIRLALNESESTRHKMMEKIRLFEEKQFTNSILKFCSVLIDNKKKLKKSGLK